MIMRLHQNLPPCHASAMIGTCDLFVSFLVFTLDVKFQFALNLVCIKLTWKLISADPLLWHLWKMRIKTYWQALEYQDEESLDEV